MSGTEVGEKQQLLCTCTFPQTARPLEDACCPEPLNPLGKGTWMSSLAFLVSFLGKGWAPLCDCSFVSLIPFREKWESPEPVPAPWTFRSQSASRVNWSLSPNFRTPHPAGTSCLPSPSYHHACFPLSWKPVFFSSHVFLLAPTSSPAPSPHPHFTRRQPSPPHSTQLCVFVHRSADF